MFVYKLIVKKEVLGMKLPCYGHLECQEKSVSKKKLVKETVVQGKS